MTIHTISRVRSRLSGVARVCLLIALTAPAALPAQLIRVKTVPVTEGDQFAFLPAANTAMAVSIAVVDSINDPFRNPAAGARLTRGLFFASPSAYSLTHSAGTGGTLPIGALMKRGSNFGGAMFAVQEIGPTEQSSLFGGGDLAVADFSPGGPTAARRRETNRYAMAMLGHTVAGARLSVAGSAFLSRLNGIDGADLMYAGAQSVRQTGDAVDLRLGILKWWDGDRSFEAVALRGQSDMNHDVSYSDASWDPTLRQVKFTTRMAHNAERAETFGAHFAYRQALADSAWHAGGILTVNHTSHPVMPSLGSMDLSREPGTSSAFNAGVGLSRARAGTTVGIDAVYEPIWSRTSPSGTANDDRYRFSNAIVRGGASRDFALHSPGDAIRVMVGAQVRAVHYTLDQIDSLQSSHRTTERWNEWTHSWGASYISPSIGIHWLCWLRSGTSRPGVSSSSISFAPFPSGPTQTLVPVRAFTEQFSITVPIR